MCIRNASNKLCLSLYNFISPAGGGGISYTYGPWVNKMMKWYPFSMISWLTYVPINKNCDNPHVIHKVKVNIFFSYSAVQSPVVINILWLLGYIRKLACTCLPGETISLPVCVHTATRNIKLAHTPPSQGTNSHFGRVVLLRFIFKPREIHVRSV